MITSAFLMRKLTISTWQFSMQTAKLPDGMLFGIGIRPQPLHVQTWRSNPAFGEPFIHLLKVGNLRKQQLDQEMDLPKTICYTFVVF